VKVPITDVREISK